MHNNSSSTSMLSWRIYDW